VGLVRELDLEPARVGSKSATRRHRSRLQGKLTVARPPRRLLAPTDVPHTDVFRRIVVRVRFRLALLTAETVSIRAILVGCEATLGAPFRRVRRPDLFHRNADRFGFVLDLFVQRSECPLVAPRRTRAVADVGQVLERDHVALVSECFVYDGVRRLVEYVADIPEFAATRPFERSVGASGPGLLESGAYLLELAEVVGYLSPTKEGGGTCDGEVFDTEVNPEDRSVLGGFLFSIGLRSAEADVQKVVAVTGGERTFRNAPFVRVEVLPLVAIVGIGKGERTPDPTLRGGERNCVVIEQRHCPGVVLHRGCGEGRLADFLAVGPAFDTAGDGLCGLVGGENRVLTPEASLLTHVVVGEGLHVALGVALAPRHVGGELATTLPLRDGFLKQLALLTIY